MAAIELVNTDMKCKDHLDDKTKGSMAAPMPKARVSRSHSQPKNAVTTNKASASVSREHSSEGIFG